MYKKKIMGRGRFEHPNLLLATGRDHCCCRIIVIILLPKTICVDIVLNAITRYGKTKTWFWPEWRTHYIVYFIQDYLLFFIPFVILLWSSFRISAMCGERMIFPVENRTCRPVFYFKRLLTYIFPLHLRLNR